MAEPAAGLGSSEVDAVEQQGQLFRTHEEAGGSGLWFGPGEAALFQSFCANPEAGTIEDEDFEASVLAVSEEE